MFDLENAILFFSGSNDLLFTTAERPFLPTPPDDHAAFA